MGKRNRLLLLVVVIIPLLVLAVAKDQLIKNIVVVGASQVVGAPVSIGNLSLGIFSQSVRISDFKIYNPKGFPEGILIDLPKISVSLDVPALLKKKLHLKELTVELKEVGLVKNKEKKLNVDSLKVAKQQEKPTEEKMKKASEQMPMQIDVFNLNMGRLVMKDYSIGAEPSVAVYDINIKKTYKNINSPQQLAALILSEPMKSAGVKGAAIYGVAMLTGVGFIPIAIAATFGSKDSIQLDLDIDLDKVYETSLNVLKRSGKVIKLDKTGGIITANVNAADVNIKLTKEKDKTRVIISARKYMLPKREIASGILYQINAELKK